MPPSQVILSAILWLVDMAKFIDITGQRFGRLSVQSRDANKGTRATWKCLCDCGSVLVVDGKKLRTGHTKSCGCYRKEISAPKQGLKNRLNIDEVHSKLKKNGFELISEYEGIMKTAKFKCLNCNIIFTRKIESSLYGINGCPRCSKAMNGFIGSNYFIKNPQMKTEPCKLYLIEFTGNDEHFWKIGITRVDVDQRIKKIPYSGRVLKVIENTMDTIYEMEKKIKQENKKNRYYPKIKFNGHSECFLTPPELI